MSETGLITGLAAIQAQIDRQNQDFDSDAPKATWFKLKGGQSSKVLFLQEFDENSPNYNPEVGTLLLAVEHNNPGPNMYTRKALCTKEDGACVGCEMNKANPKKGWNQKMRLYANVLVDNGKDAPFVAILSQGIGGKSITPTLAQMAVDYKGITQTLFRINRTGTEMNNTSYTILPLIGADLPSTEGLELYDLKTTATRKIEYEKQAEFYGIEAEVEEPKSESASDFEW
jgi:hypothetical protein